MPLLEHTSALEPFQHQGLIANVRSNIPSTEMLRAEPVEAQSLLEKFLHLHLQKPQA